MYDAAIAPLVRDVYTAGDRAQLRACLTNAHTFDFAPLRSGLYPATPSVSSEEGRYRYAWVRDNVYVAHALWRSGDERAARNVVHALATYFDAHADRFDLFITGHGDMSDPMQRPHVRFEGDTLKEVPEHWSHMQHDAHGLFLWIVGMLVREGGIDLDPLLVRVVSRTIRFLDAVAFAESADSGAWEEGVGVRASSIGAVCAGLIIWHELLHDYDHELSHHAYELYDQGMVALSHLLPREVAQGREVREYDAALLFLVSPLNVLAHEQAEDVVERTKRHLVGERGIKRYIGDAFWGPDYDMLSLALRTSDASRDDSFRASYAVVGQEAEWTLFDPLLAEYYRTQHDERNSAAHLNRALAALVREGDKLLIPELYYRKQGVLTPNTIVPLYWAQANLLLALSA